MKKSILNLGKTLERKELKTINGGRFICCSSDLRCPPPYFETSCIIIGGTCRYYEGEGTGC